LSKKALRFSFRTTSRSRIATALDRWLDAQAQNAPDENTRLFAQWRARHGLSLTEAAKALGMTPRTMSAYGSGSRPVPRYIALACKGWEAEHESKR
jgi:DNA-binding XRE family transcriptional regulator